MTPALRAAVWIAGAALVIYLLSLLSGVLLPFVVALTLAYFLDPVAEKLQAWGCSRLVATIVITAAFFVAAAGVVVLLAPILQAQVIGFAARLPNYVTTLREWIGPWIERLRTSLAGEDLSQIREAAGSYAGQAVQWIGGMLAGVMVGGRAIVSLVSVVFIAPVVTFYLLLDWHPLIRRIDSLLPEDAAPTIRAQARAIDRVIAGFVRGQATVCLILACYYATALTLIGIDFGLLIGVGAGLLSFIPYFGMLTGLVVSVIMALIQFKAMVPIVLVIAVFVVAQAVEGVFLTPRLVGRSIGLHPVWIIFALMAGGTLFGFTGVLIAVPVAAAIGVLARFATERYRASSLYKGGQGRAR